MTSSHICNAADQTLAWHLVEYLRGVNWRLSFRAELVRIDRFAIVCDKVVVGGPLNTIKQTAYAYVKAWQQSREVLRA